MYGLMLDRMSLSLKNAWIDEEGRAYIYFTTNDVMEPMVVISYILNISAAVGEVFIAYRIEVSV